MINIDDLLKQIDTKNIPELVKGFDAKKETLKQYLEAIIIYLELEDYLEEDNHKDADGYSELVKEQGKLGDYISYMHRKMFNR